MHIVQGFALRCAHQLSRFSSPAVLLTLPIIAWSAPISPFVAASAGVYDRNESSVVPEVVQSSATGPLTLTIGTLPVAYGRYEPAFGSNKHFVEVRGGDDREVSGGSMWTDGLTVVGGSGSEIATLSARITGTVAAGADMGFALYTSDQPFDLQVILDASKTVNFWNLQLPNATRRIFTGVANGCGGPFPSDNCGHFPYENFQGAFDQTLFASLSFTFGQTFHVASILMGRVGVSGGSSDFSNSADFGITAPAPASIESISGTAYATAVPEPQVWAMLLSGLAAVVAIGRSRRAGRP